MGTVAKEEELDSVVEMGGMRGTPQGEALQKKDDSASALQPGWEGCPGWLRAFWSWKKRKPRDGHRFSLVC